MAGCTDAAAPGDPTCPEPPPSAGCPWGRTAGFCPGAELSPTAGPLPAALLPESGLYTAYLEGLLPTLAPPADVAAWEQRRAELQEVLREGLGLDRLPGSEEPVPARLVATLDRGAVQVETLLLEGVPGIHVPALLLRPADLAPGERRPGILLHHGHLGPGKHHPTILTAGFNLAAQGFVVLAPDWLDFGDLGRWENSHWIAAAAVLGEGPVQHPLTSLARRMLDYLAARPEVDPARLGATGHSGGGETLFHQGAADDRIRALAVVDGVFDWSTKIHQSLPAHPEHYVAGFLGQGGSDTLLALRAPRPTLVLTGDEDDVVARTADVAPLVERARAVFARYGASAMLLHEGYPGGHALSRPKRESLYGFFAEHLLRKAGPVVEPATYGDSAELHLTPPRDNGTLVAAVRAQLDAALRQRPPAAGLPACLEGLLAPDAPAAGEDAVTFQATWRGVAGETGGLLARPGQPPLPVLVQPAPGCPWPRGKVLCLADEGRAGCLAPAAALAGREALVAMLDVRATGELTEGFSPETDPAAPNRLGGFVLALGGSLAGQRVHDLRAGLRLLRHHPAEPVALVARGPRATVTALLAAATDPHLGPVLIQGSPGSLRVLLDQTLAEVLPFPADLFLPGLLTCADVPGLQDALADRPLLEAPSTIDEAGWVLLAQALVP
ncbi:MAG: prolyl oligopeptidase family serine peptidase [Myxococcota bacterium]|nr:prolyl oligopeptidase family serine peptidase [Myxococcota bacterium]